MDYIKKWGTNASTIENYEAVLETVSGNLEPVKKDGKQLNDLYIQNKFVENYNQFSELL